MIYDASQSTDPENDPISFAWFEAGLTNAFATGAIVTNSLVVGDHMIQLVLSASGATASTNLTVEVISLARAVGELLLVVEAAELKARNKEPLLATLAAAMASMERGNLAAGLEQLVAFQAKARTQVAPFNRGTAESFIWVAKQIIDAIRVR